MIPATERGEPLPHVCVYTDCFHRHPRTHTHTHTHSLSALPPGENEHLIKRFTCASAEVDYMYLARIIISGSHVHYNYRQHLCSPHLQSLPRMPSGNLTVIISTGGKGNVQQQRYSSITLLLKMPLRSHHERKKHRLNRIP